jgi:very-short-patch-repair endonuclease
VRRSAIQQEVRSGRWTTIQRGVYIPTADLVQPEAHHIDHQLLAAHLAWAGPQAALSHHSAARVHGFDSTTKVDGEWLIVPQHVHRASPTATVTRSRTLALTDVESRHGLEVTSRARTLRDLATVVEPDELERILESALRGDSHLRPDVWRVDLLAELEARVAGPHRQPGLGQLAACLRGRPDGCRPTGSIAETALLQALRRAGITDVIRQPKVVIDPGDGERLTFFPDFLIPSRRLLLEVDGGAHLDRKRHQSDLNRQNELLAGFLMRRRTALDALSGCGRIVGQVLGLPECDSTRGWTLTKRVSGKGLSWKIS